jgi:hypothetical protein
VSRIRLTRKLAATLNGLNVSTVRVGEVMEVSDSDAVMMVAEGWAESIDDQAGRGSTRGGRVRSVWARPGITRRKPARS